MNVKIEEKKYSNNTILKDVDIAFNSGCISTIIGKSGCGKTTMLKIIGGLDIDFKGSIDVEATNIGYVEQTPLLIEKFSARENIVLGLEQVDDTKLLFLAKLLKIEEYLYTKCSNLSIGQRQRVCILRCLIRNYSYILLDEPTSSIDRENTKILLNILRDISKETNVGIIISTHDKYVIEFSDIVYEYSNKNFIVTKNELVNTKISVINTIAMKPIKKLTNYYYIKYFFKNLVFISAYAVILFTVLYFLVSLNNTLQTQYDTYYDSLSSDYIFVQKDPTNTTCSDDINCTTEYDFENITFSDEEIKTISEIEGVDNVITSTNESNTKLDQNGNELNPLMIEDEFFASAELEYLIEIRQNILNSSEDMSNITYDNSVSYKFRSINVPIEYIEAIGYYSPNNTILDIMYGDNNLTYSDEIIIPYSLAIYISNLSQVPVEELVGQTITLETTNFNTGNVSNNTYKIIGIYSEENAKTVNDLGNIYVIGDTSVTAEEQYEVFMSKYGSNKYFTELYPNSDGFLQSNTATTTLIIESSNIKEVEAQIQKMYPEAVVISKNIYFDTYFVQDKLLSIILQITLSMLTIIALIFSKRKVKKIYIKSINNDYNVFRGLRYEIASISKFFSTIDTYNFVISIFILLIMLILARL